MHVPLPLALPPPSTTSGTAGSVSAIEQVKPEPSAAIEQPKPEPSARDGYTSGADPPLEILRHVVTLQRVVRGVLVRRGFVSALRSRLSVRCASCLGRCTETMPVGLRKYLPWHKSQYDRLEEDQEAKKPEDDELVGMAKMSRLGTDLANERTFLAWIRTILAMMRTVFATLGVAGLTTTWEAVHRFAVCLSVLLMVTAAIIGNASPAFAVSQRERTAQRTERKQRRQTRAFPRALTCARVHTPPLPPKSCRARHRDQSLLSHRAHLRAQEHPRVLWQEPGSAVAHGKRPHVLARHCHSRCAGSRLGEVR